MRRSILFAYFFIIFYNFSFAQVSDLVFIGSAMVKGGQAYTYKLQVTDSGGILTGYSVTDVMGANETKTAVTGHINTAKKQIDFRETKIIYTKSKSDDSDFCYIHGHLKVTKIQGATSLKGSFKGYKKDGKTECATGRLVLVCAQDILDKLMKIANEDSVANPREDTTKKAQKNVSLVYEKEVPASQIQKVQPGNTLELACPSAAIAIEVWDSKTIDGDRITLLQDNVPVLEDYTISATHKTLNLDMGSSKTMTLRLIALNEGSEPLNTARLKVTSGNKEYYIDATTTMDKNVTVVLKRKE